jgi:hypothetical protein
MKRQKVSSVNPSAPSDLVKPEGLTSALWGSTELTEPLVLRQALLARLLEDGESSASSAERLGTVEGVKTGDNSSLDTFLLIRRLSDVWDT